MVVFKYNGKVKELPLLLNQLNQKQLLRLVSTFYLAKKTARPDISFYKLNLLAICLEEGPAFFKRWQRDAAKDCRTQCSANCGNAACKGELYAAELTEALKAMDVFFEKQAGGYVLKTTLTINPLPLIKMKGVRHIGTDDCLENLSFDKWMEADLHYNQYARDQQPKHLTALIKCLYQAFNHKGNPVPCRLARLSETKRQLILLYFISSRNFLAKVFDRVFKEAPKGEAPAGSPWYDVKFAIAKWGVFGDFDKVGGAKIADILKHLEKIDEDREAEERRQAIAAAKRRG